MTRSRSNPSTGKLAASPGSAAVHGQDYRRIGCGCSGGADAVVRRIGPRRNCHVTGSACEVEETALRVGLRGEGDLAVERHCGRSGGDLFVEVFRWELVLAARGRTQSVIFLGAPDGGEEFARAGYGISDYSSAGENKSGKHWVRSSWTFSCLNGFTI